MFIQKAFTSFSVRDLKKAKKFYGEILELGVQEKPEGLELRVNGNAPVFAYFSPTNKPADYTILNFVVDDIEKVVETLTKKGVRMEQYDMPGIKTDEKGIARNTQEGPYAMAWFKDPSDNIVSILQEKKT